MPAEVLTGIAALNGIQNNGSAITLKGYATFVIQKLASTHNFDIADLKDERGFDVAAKATNTYKEIDADFTPASTTRALTASFIDTLTAALTPLCSVAIANCKVTSFNGTYQYRGGGIVTQDASGDVKVTGMKLRKYDDATQNTSLTTVVVG